MVAPSPRARDEALILRRDGAPDRVLAERRELTFDVMVPTQRRFQVSPDARVLAHTDSSATQLELTRRDGAELRLPMMRDGDLRFSPDGSEMALMAESDGKHRIDRVDLRRMEARTWAAVRAPTWMEHCASGLLVAHGAERAGGAISLLPPEGPPQKLVESNWILRRFTAASAGTRLAYLAGTELFSIEAPGAAPRKIADVQTNNLEMSPDGRSIAVATWDGLLLFEGDRPAQRLSQEHDIHSVWFSRNGELAWASPDVAVWRRGDVERKLVPVTSEGRIAGLRFLRGGAGLVLARGQEVVRWHPDRDECVTLTRNEDASRELLGADVFGGGIVMWLARQGPPRRGT